MKEYIIDFRTGPEKFCDDCPDHEACSLGLPCELVKEVNEL